MIVYDATTKFKQTQTFTNMQKKISFWLKNETVEPEKDPLTRYHRQPSLGVGHCSAATIVNLSLKRDTLPWNIACAINRDGGSDWV